MGMRAFEKRTLRTDHKLNLVALVRLDFTQLPHQFDDFAPAQIARELTSQQARQKHLLFVLKMIGHSSPSFLVKPAVLLSVAFQDAQWFANLKFLKTLRITVNKPATNSRIRDQILILLLAFPHVFRSLRNLPRPQGLARRRS
jgi:hypothetical protein